NSTEKTRSAVFAAQFSLSHACFLVTYPLAGGLGAIVGLPAVGLVLVAFGIIGAVFAALTWFRNREARDTSSPGRCLPLIRVLSILILMTSTRNRNPHHA